MSVEVIVSFFLAYFIGAIPTSVWFGKIFYRKDVRNFGSGNAGATNTFRVFGAGAGIIVLIIDIAKGAAAVLLSKLFPVKDFFGDNFLYYQMALGLTAALGHIFPVYLNFKGGKGVATFFGVVLTLFPVAALACTVTFFILFLITKYVSVGSIVASLAFMITILLYYVESARQIPLILFSLFVPAIIIFTHRENIQRLLSGRENKFSFSEKN